MYEIFISERAKKQLKKLDKKYQIHISSVIERIRLRPFAHVKAIVGSNYYRARAGDYRIILDIKEGKLIIVIIEIGHRRRIYK